MNRGISDSRMIVRIYTGEMDRKEFFKKLIKLYLEERKTSTQTPGRVRDMRTMQGDEVLGGRHEST
jgi:hypothetical protein